jgi:hypothetical protein
LWGYLDDKPPADLVKFRQRVFAGVSNPHHWIELQRLVDGVPAETLRQPHTAIFATAWQDLIDVGSYDADH